jgi:2'-aminobiphenyl-2,3-diol 1,2-dioxygenase small subunit
MKPHRAHLLIQSLFSTPRLLERLQLEREAVFEEFELSTEEKNALRDGGASAMGEVGIHPILQMHYMLASNPGMAAHLDISDFIRKLKDD